MVNPKLAIVYVGLGQLESQPAMAAPTSLGHTTIFSRKSLMSRMQSKQASNGYKQTKEQKGKREFDHERWTNQQKMWKRHRSFIALRVSVEIRQPCSILDPMPFPLMICSKAIVCLSVCLFNTKPTKRYWYNKSCCIHVIVRPTQHTHLPSKRCRNQHRNRQPAMQ